MTAWKLHTFEKPLGRPVRRSRPRQVFSVVHVSLRRSIVALPLRLVRPTSCGRGTPCDRYREEHHDRGTVRSPAVLVRTPCLQVPYDRLETSNETFQGRDPRTAGRGRRRCPDRGRGQSDDGEQRGGRQGVLRSAERQRQRGG